MRARSVSADQSKSWFPTAAAWMPIRSSASIVVRP